MGRMPGPFFRLVISNIFMSKADLIFCVGNYIKNLLEKMGVDSKRIFSVGTGIDYDHIQSIRYGEKVFDACFMGSISPMKGIYDLIKIWKLIVEEKPSAKLLVMGSGKTYHIKKVQQMIDSFHLQQNVVLKGFISGDRKYEMLKSSKIFVFPSYLESMAIAICEAMACKLPVVAYNLPVYKEWFGDSIMRAKIGNIFDLKDKILLLLEDNNLRDRMGVKGLKRAGKYSFDSIANQMMNIITQKLF
jgi:glycosyltransferase involved in cell wall biosynthesis